MHACSSSRKPACGPYVRMAAPARTLSPGARSNRRHHQGARRGVRSVSARVGETRRCSAASSSSRSRAEQRPVCVLSFWRPAARRRRRERKAARTVAALRIRTEADSTQRKYATDPPAPGSRRDARAGRAGRATASTGQFGTGLTLTVVQTDARSEKKSLYRLVQTVVQAPHWPLLLEAKSEKLYDAVVPTQASAQYAGVTP